jgi:hypothetical protein
MDWTYLKQKKNKKFTNEVMTPDQYRANKLAKKRGKGRK